ncbi:MAG: hypothetical protein ABSE73_12730 [Planctomycetota bacterium]
MAARVISPKIPVSTKVTLFGGETVAGEFFVSATSPRHPGPETMLELLNDDARAFVPFQTQEGIFLLHRATVRSVDFESVELLDIFTRHDNECVYSLAVILRTEQPEEPIQGYCFTGHLPQGAQRPADLLNSSDMFLLLFSNERMILINKNAISHALV